MLTVLAVLAVLAALGGLPWLLAAVLLPRWVRTARWPIEDEDAVVLERLHVVVPARNEADLIGPTVERLASIRGDGVSITIVDDQSTDGTAARARTALSGHRRADVMLSGARPTGWSGKAWACQQGAEQGLDADWLLFIDADVRIDPRLPGALLRRASPDRDLVSAFGRWALPTVGVAWLMPALGWLVRGSVVPEAVASGKQAFANGQVILVRAACYRAVGGHAAIRSEVLDDVRLAEAVRDAGGRAALVWMPEGFTVRAYDSVLDLLLGYRKNLLAGLGGRRGVGLLAAAGVLWAYLGPPLAVALGLGLAAPLPVLLGALGTVAIVGVRLALDRLEGRSGWLAPLQPLAGLPIAFVLAWSALSRRTRWKGRAFVDGRASNE